MSRNLLFSQFKASLRKSLKNRAIFRSVDGATMETDTKIISLSATDRAKDIKYTHFLSIPFATNEIKANLLKFKGEVLKDFEACELQGEYELLFQKPEKLHMTLVMLGLSGDDEKSRLASEHLQECKQKILDPLLKDGPLTVQLMGVDHMRSDPMHVRVLYGKVVSEELQRIANEMAQSFFDQGFARDKDNVKLHVTLMNSRFLPKKKRKRTFDASQILEKYKDFYFGTLEINEIHLSQLFAKDPNGYYAASYILKLNGEEEIMEESQGSS